MEQFTESKVDKEQMARPVPTQLHIVPGVPFLNNTTPNEGPTNIPSCQIHLHPLISQFSSCGYLAFNQRKNDIAKLGCFSNEAAVLKPRFDFPDKHLGNTLQGACYTARCFDRKDRQYRCVKAASKGLVLAKKSLKNVSVFENFLREQQLLRKLSAMKDCPNSICKLITHWECDLFYYFATEYCPGGNLFYYTIHVLHANPSAKKKRSNLFLFLLIQIVTFVVIQSKKNVFNFCCFFFLGTDWNQQAWMRAYPYTYCPKDCMYLRLRVIQKIFAQVVSAVEWLHSKNISHLDLSLENILVQNENVFDPQIQIIDFGVGVDFGELDDESGKEDVIEKGRSKRRRWNANVGKPGYKAFEVRMSDSNRRKVRLTEISSKRAAAIKQIQGNQAQAQSKTGELITEIAICDMLLNYVIDKTYDPFKADIWSMGVILFLLLFCRYPFHHADLDDSLFQIILQDKLLFWFMQQKALCWITAETFDVLNQMLKPEFLRIDMDRLFLHPFCKLTQNTSNHSSIHSVIVGDIEIAQTIVVLPASAIHSNATSHDTAVSSSTLTFLEKSNKM
ncbi:hypothetical protein RFI_11858 [Reticulomyxa filosa]|uniref:Protein kinase domain-containing protein n=1 Tax=Reticulomyxa filosa TaxID=46433 RepID=X6NHQ1_RETFI|nr:hypothetical protein RFI_11858 [Reticulomyxa filosa]|eukprot:ETO25274.1 hypothetical protein RFI_11858 [Reticulomyxa filosa]